MVAARFLGPLPPWHKLHSDGMCAAATDPTHTHHGKGPTWPRPLVLLAHVVLLGAWHVAFVPGVTP